MDDVVNWFAVNQSNYETLTKCRFNVGPSSATLEQHIKSTLFERLMLPECVNINVCINGSNESMAATPALSPFVLGLFREEPWGRHEHGKTESAAGSCGAAQSQKAVSAHFASEQILPFAFAEQLRCSPIAAQSAVPRCFSRA